VPVLAGSHAVSKTSPDAVFLSATNLLTGTVAALGRNIVVLSNGAALASAAGVQQNGGSLAFSGTTEATLRALTGDLALVNTAGLGVALTLNGNADATYAGMPSGSGSLITAGSGRLTLSGSSTYAGATSVRAGILDIQNASALGTANGNTTVLNGAALELQGGLNVGQEALVLSGTGVSNGGALRSVSGSNAVGGTITLASDTRITGDAGQLTLSGNVNGTNFGVTFGGGAALSVSGSIALGTGSLTKDGSGFLTLSGANTYTGATNISAGTLTVNGSGSLASTALTVNTGATLFLKDSASLSNASALTVSGSVGFLTAAQTVSSINGSGVISIDSTALTVGTGAFSGVISGGGSLSKSATGTLVLSGLNTFTGGVNLSGGWIQIGQESALGSALGSGSLTISGGALSSTDSTARSLANPLSFSDTITLGDVTKSGSLLFSGNAALAAASTLNTASAVTFDGVVSGRFGLTKSGAAALSLNRANTYYGATVVSGGLLAGCRSARKHGVDCGQWRHFEGSGLQQHSHLDCGRERTCSSESE
jgi:autotransporter-associated beta strand protein